MPSYIEPLLRPPNEAGSLIFQITLGCSRNQCTFCGMYKGKPVRLSPKKPFSAPTMSPISSTWLAIT